MIIGKISVFITKLSVILLVYQASLVGHMDKLHLVEPNTVFMEFGAGRGQCLMLIKCCSHVFFSAECEVKAVRVHVIL